MYVRTEYLRHRARSRGFDLSIIEDIVAHSRERYFDTATRRMVAVGRHGGRLAAVPFERQDGRITPITVHATTRRQINFRLKTGRYTLP